jgi:hypothetical protein
MANTVYMSKTGLIGGEATKLDSIDGAVLVDGDAAFVNVSNVQYIYRLDADSGAVESSPNIIAPDTNPGTKRWILQGLNGASLNMPGLSASLPVFTDGSKNLVSNTMTGTGKVVMDTSPTISAPTISGHPIIEGVTPTGATGTGKLVFDTSPTLVTPTIGAASGTSLTLSGLTASLPVFTDGSKALVSKSVADTLTALGVGSAAFQAYLTTTQSEVTGDDTDYNVTGAIWTEVFDTGSCFSNGTFTAPATGIYLFAGVIQIDDFTIDFKSLIIRLITSVGNYRIWHGNPGGAADLGGYSYSFPFSIVIPLSATNTVYIHVRASGGSKIVDVVGNGLTEATVFSGYRLK